MNLKKNLIYKFKYDLYLVHIILYYRKHENKKDLAQLRVANIDYKNI